MIRTKIHSVPGSGEVVHQPGGFLRQDVPAGLAGPHHPTHATSTRQGGGDAAIVGAERGRWSW